MVVDDHLMEITTAVRGEEWLPSAPLHVLLYEAFGWEQPEWAHMPLLRNADRSKVSKRKNNTSLEWYRDNGYLPEAMLNFLASNGWSMPDGREQFTLADMVAYFSWERVVTTGPVFDLTRLTSLNAHYLQRRPFDQLCALYRPLDAGGDRAALPRSYHPADPRARAARPGRGACAQRHRHRGPGREADGQAR